MTEDELIEVHLQVLWPNRARMRANQPALQQRDRPVASLHGVGLALRGFGLDDSIVCTLAEARLVVAGVPVGRDGSNPGDLAVSPPIKQPCSAVVNSVAILSGAAPSM